MTIGTCTNKYNDRITPETIFICKNVSKWRFLRFDIPFKGKHWTLKPWKNIENADFWWLFRLQGAVKNFWDVVWHQTKYLKCSRSVGLSNDTICVSIRCPTPFLIEKKFCPPPPILHGLELASLPEYIVFPNWDGEKSLNIVPSPNGKRVWFLLLTSHLKDYA